MRGFVFPARITPSLFQNFEDSPFSVRFAIYTPRNEVYLQRT